MTDKPYVEARLWGEDRDLTIKLESLKGLDDERLGRLIRALGKTASVYREAERSEHCPPFDFGLRMDRSREANDARNKAYDAFSRRMTLVDGFIGEKIKGVVDYSNIDPKSPAMYSKSAVFKNGEPVLYWEHWATDDLCDSDRDSVEFQMFVGLNDHLHTEHGRKLAHNILDVVLDGSQISYKEVPSGLRTLGTAPESIFVPFLRG